MMANHVRLLVLSAALAAGSQPLLAYAPQEAQNGAPAERAPSPPTTPTESQDENPPASAPGSEPQRPTRRAGLLPLAVGAEINLPSRPVGPALLHDKTLVLATTAGELLSLDAATLVTRWKLGMPGEKLFTPCLVAGGVLVASAAGNLVLVQPDTGEILKESPLGSPIVSTPSCDPSLLYLATPDHEVLAYDLQEWKEIWRTKLQAPLIGLSRVSGLVLASDDAAGLNALDAANGALRWQFQGRGNIDAPAVFDEKEDRLYVGDTGGFFYSISARDGNVRYRWANGGAIAQPALLEEDRLMVVSYANTLFCYRTGNGHELWRTNLPGRPAFAPVHVRRRLVVLTLNGQVSEYLPGGQPSPLIYQAPDDILPYPTFLPGGLVLPLRSGKLLLLETREPTPAEAAQPGAVEPGPGEVPEDTLAPDDLTSY